MAAVTKALPCGILKICQLGSHCSTYIHYKKVKHIRDGKGQCAEMRTHHYQLSECPQAEQWAGFGGTCDLYGYAQPVNALYNKGVFFIFDVQ